MKIKIKLLKPKPKHSSFYKTSQIQFKNISSSQKANFRFRSTQKVIASQSPWNHLSNEEIQVLIQRLQDKPQMLYKVIKNRKDQLKAHKIKFSKINNENRQVKDKLRQKIRLKRLQCQQEYRKLFRQKNRLVLMTDLPRIGKIKAINQSNYQMQNVKNQQKTPNLLKIR